MRVLTKAMIFTNKARKIVKRHRTERSLRAHLIILDKRNKDDNQDGIKYEVILLFTYVVKKAAGIFSEIMK